MNEHRTEVMTLHDIAEELRVSRSTAYRLCRDPEFPAFRVGGLIRITRKDLDAWMQRPLGLHSDVTT